MSGISGDPLDEENSVHRDTDSEHSTDDSMSTNSGSGETDTDPESEHSSEEEYETDDSMGTNISSNDFMELENTTQAVDRFSNLPDAILLKIFAEFPLDKAIQYSVLSKRFEHLWKSLPTLRYIDKYPRYKTIDFIEFVEDTLQVINANHQIEKFVVCFRYQFHDSILDRWLEFSTKRKVEELVLPLSFGSNYVEPMECGRHDLVEDFFYRDNTNLKRICCYYVNFMPRGNVNWCSMKSLSITFTRMSDEVFQKILSGCPVLETFYLTYWTHLNYLNINSKSLKHFGLRYEWYQGYPEDFDIIKEDLVISAPYLRSLTISGLLLRYGILKLMNLHSLVNAHIEVSMYIADTEAPCHSFFNLSSRRNELRQMLEELRHVKELTLGSWCIEVLRTFNYKSLPSSMSKCKHLVLDGKFNKKLIDGMPVLFKVSPQVHKLTIFAEEGCSLADTDGSCNLTTDNYNLLWNNYFKHLMPTLELVQVTGFNPKDETMKHIIALIRYILSNATTLKKIIVYASRADESYLESMPRETLEVAQKLLCLPRASPHALIQVVE